MSLGVFEALAHDETDQRLAKRKALITAKARLEQAFGKFLTASSPEEFDAKFSLVSTQFNEIIDTAAREQDTDAAADIARTLHSHYRTAQAPIAKDPKVDPGDHGLTTPSKKAPKAPWYKGVESESDAEAEERSKHHMDGADEDGLDGERKGNFQKGSPDPGDDQYFGGEPGSSHKAFKAMVDEYGKDKGEEVYYATRNKHKGKGSSVHEAEKWIQKATEKPGFEEGGLHRALDVPEGEKIPESKIENAEESGSKNLKEKAQFAENVKGKKSKWEKRAAKEQKRERKASLKKLARRPKMCPYHGEVVDISLASGNPQAGYEVMQNHAWGDEHCQGSWDGGKCKFEPSMTAQSFWDERDQKLQDERNRREQEGFTNVVDFPVDEVISPTEAPETDGGEILDFPDSGTSTDLPVAEPSEAAPVAVEARVAAEGADAKDGYTQETDKLPTAEKDSVTGLGGPVPKIDKGPSRKPGDTTWGLDSVDPKSERNPTVKKDIQDYDRPTYIKDSVKGDVEEIGTHLTDTQDLPTVNEAPDLDSSGFAPNNMEMAPHTDQWGNDGQTDPVQRGSLEGATSSMRWSRVTDAS